MRNLGLLLWTLCFTASGSFAAVEAQSSDILEKAPLFLQQGVPALAMTRALDFYAQSYGHHLKLKSDNGSHIVPFRNDHYMAIIDYSQPSTEKRLYLLDLKTGLVEKHFVAHGLNSGSNRAYRFSNRANSKQTSLGIFITGPLYKSPTFGGQAMKIYGAEASNDNAYKRLIVLHRADYASPSFMQWLAQERQLVHLGRSHGCFALDPAVATQIIGKLSGGALIMAYHQDLMAQAQLTPDDQEILHNDPEDDKAFPTFEEINQLPGLFKNTKFPTPKATPESSSEKP